MPPRIVVAIIVAFWLFSIGWLLERDYLPWVSWLHPESPPPFTVEIADEAAPMPAHWKIRRGETPIGDATTRMICRKDGNIALQSTIENLELLPPTTESGAPAPLQLKVPRLTTNQLVTRDGQLISINSNIQLDITLSGKKFDAHARLEGEARDGMLYSRGRLESSFGDIDQELDPMPLASGSAMNPLQPVAKLRVWPGQHWKITNVDPLSQAIKSAEKQWPLLKVLDGLSGPTVWEARVDTEPVTLIHRGEPISCYVVNYRARNVSGRTWVQVSDGMVFRQEVTGMGEITLALTRDD